MARPHRTDKGNLAEPRIAFRDAQRELAGACADIDQVVVAIQRRQREQQLALVLRLTLGASGMRGIVQVVPGWMLPRLGVFLS